MTAGDLSTATLLYLSAPTFTPALVPGRGHIPARVPATRPLARAAPRESAHIYKTAPEPAPLRHPRFVPHAQPAGQGRHHRPARGLQRTSSV